MFQCVSQRLSHYFSLNIALVISFVGVYMVIRFEVALSMINMLRVRTTPHFSVLFICYLFICLLFQESEF